MPGPGEGAGLVLYLTTRSWLLFWTEMSVCGAQQGSGAGGGMDVVPPEVPLAWGPPGGTGHRELA